MPFKYFKTTTVEVKENEKVSDNYNIWLYHNTYYFYRERKNVHALVMIIRLVSLYLFLL